MASGSTACDMVSSHENMPSIRPSTHSSTQTVIGQRHPDQQSGDQVLSSRLRLSRDCAARSCASMAAHTPQPHRRLPAEDFGSAGVLLPAGVDRRWLPLGHVSPGLRSGAASSVCRPRSGFLAAVLLLKSVAYQPEPLSWKPAAVTCLANVGRAARRAHGQRRIGQLLQHVLGVTAGRAPIGVDRHG